MEIHKVIDSPEAAVYLPFALSKLRFLQQSTNYYVSQKYLIDGVTIHIQHNPDFNQQHVRLSGGALRYEFFTSEKIVFTPGYGTPPYTGAYDASFVAGHSTVVRASESNFRAEMASSFNDLNGATHLEVDGSSPYTAAPKWLGKIAYNNQKVAFHHEYTTKPIEGKSIDRVIYSAMPAGGQHTMAHDNVPKGSSGLNINPAKMGSDIGWDIRQPVFKNSAMVARLQPLLKPPFWWRRGTVALAKDAEGNEHSITIVTDAMSNFYFFRTRLGDDFTVSQDGYVDRYVLPENLVKVEASSFLPGWVEQPTVETMRPYLADQTNLYGYSPATTSFFFAFPEEAPRPYNTNTTMPDGDEWTGGENTDDVVQIAEYLWAFNSDGTSAAAVVHEDKGAAEYPIRAEDEAPGAGTDRPIKVMRWGYIDLWILPKTETDRAAYFNAHGKLQDIKYRQRGIVKVDIDIQINGDGPTDFTASITVAKEIKDRHFLDVDFALKHPKLAERGIERDDLITSEIELFVPDYAVNKYEVNGQVRVFFTVRNVQNEDSPTPLLRFQSDVFTDTDFLRKKIAVEDFGDLTLVTPFGGGAPVPPYDTPTGLPTHYNTTLYYMVSAFSGASDPSGHSANGTVASDLKSLSFVMTTHGNPKAGNRGAHLYILGEWVKSSGNMDKAVLTDFPDVSIMQLMPETPTQAELDLVSSATKRYDIYALYARSAAAHIPSQATHLLDVHPTGHYSAYFHGFHTPNTMESDPIIDEIAYCTVKEDGSTVYNKTTHREMFNKAFAQTRNYADYNAGAELGVGMFATAGAWI